MRAKQYVITTPTGFQKASNPFRQAMRELETQKDIQILATLAGNGDKLVSMTDAEVQQLKAKVPSLIVEPNILYKKAKHPLLENFQSLSLSSSVDTKTITIKVLDARTKASISNVRVYLTVAGAKNIGFQGLTDAQGICQLTTKASTQRFESVAVVPQSGYWSRKIRDILINDTYEVQLDSLTPEIPEIYDWGHQFAQMQDGLANFGIGVKVGIIDTGIRQDHHDLQPFGGCNCVLHEDESLWYEDDDGHGSHCAGVIAGLVNNRGIKGYVPQAQIYSYRVFAKNAEGAMTFDIAKAIQKAVEDGCDIISMSISSPTPQTAIRTKIELACDRGVVCIAATGNEASSVGYPAAFPGVLAVGAFGKFGTYPDDSLHKDNESNLKSRDRQYYCATFSNFGKQVDFCAPGVAILSTVPGGAYSVWDGTSMACPQIAGIAALALAQHLDILNAPRDAGRVERLWQLLKQSAKPMGFGDIYEGAGSLSLDNLLKM